MIEKVNPCHPDKIADRIAGAIVDLCYKKQENPKVAVEVLIGHGNIYIINETSCHLADAEIYAITEGLCPDDMVVYKEYKQDINLAQNQNNGFKCGDNGIFKGVPLTEEERTLSKIAREIYDLYKTDVKYILDGEKLIIL